MLITAVRYREDTDAMPNPAGPPTQPHPARLRVGIIGAGRVGTALGAALGRAGHHLTGVTAVSEASVQRAARMLPGVPVARPQEVLAGADLVLLTVPDDVLPGLVAGLSATGTPLEGRLLAHTSGRTASPSSRPRRASAPSRWRCTR